MKGNPTVLLLVACAAVVLSAFMPWIRFVPQLPPGFDMQGMDGFMAEAMTATGWRGDVSLAGVTAPNWFVPIFAIAIAAVTLMKEADMWDAPRAVSISLAGYCTAHLGFLIVLVALIGGSKASIAFGAPLGLLASLGALGLMIFGQREEEYETVPPRSQFEAYGAPRRGPVLDDPAQNSPVPGEPMPGGSLDSRRRPGGPKHADPTHGDPMPGDVPPPPDFSPRPRERV